MPQTTLISNGVGRWVETTYVTYRGAVVGHLYDQKTLILVDKLNLNHCILPMMKMFVTGYRSLLYCARELAVKWFVGGILASIRPHDYCTFEEYSFPSWLWLGDFKHPDINKCLSQWGPEVPRTHVEPSTRRCY